jgi:hypothetical protein
MMSDAMLSVEHGEEVRVVDIAEVLLESKAQSKS